VGTADRRGLAQEMINRSAQATARTGLRSRVAAAGRARRNDTWGSGKPTRDRSQKSPCHRLNSEGRTALAAGISGKSAGLQGADVEKRDVLGPYVWSICGPTASVQSPSPLLGAPNEADSRVMRGTVEFSDFPPVVLIERRRRPDRRRTWRGGRRDSDWINRPPGVLSRMPGKPAPGLWRWLAPLGVIVGLTSHQ
jgi:hypothetical protein